MEESLNKSNSSYREQSFINFLRNNKSSATFREGVLNNLKTIFDIPFCT